MARRPYHCASGHAAPARLLDSDLRFERGFDLATRIRFAPRGCGMRYHFQFRRYRVPFRRAVRTAHGLWTAREGVYVRLAVVSEGAPVNATGIGEAAPIPGFGTESVDEIEAACRDLGEWLEDERLDSVPRRLGCLRFAIASAREEIRRIIAASEQGARETAKIPAAARGVAALLPAGRPALGLIAEKADMGFRFFKWKVGVGDLGDELALLDDVCAALPDGAKLRLDANGAWDRRQAERWLERSSERPVEFVEQPCLAAEAESATVRGRMVDLLLGLAHDFPTPIALDESLVSENDVERWIGAGWPGIYVVKPVLLGDVTNAMARLSQAKADVVFSSALETAVGARAALRVAFEWQPGIPETGVQKPDTGNRKPESRRAEYGNPDPIENRERNPAADSPVAGVRDPKASRALGFGVWPLFTDARFNGPMAMPSVRWEDVQHLDAEAAWNALG